MSFLKINRTLLSSIFLSALSFLQCWISIDGYTEVRWRHSSHENAKPEASHGMNMIKKGEELVIIEDGKIYVRTRKLLNYKGWEDRGKHQQSFINPTADFNVVRKSPAYVDKTLFLKEWITNSSWNGYSYITAPAGFGKSSLLDMIKSFCNTKYNTLDGLLHVEDRSKTAEHRLFEGTNIILQEQAFFYKHFMQYNVIYVNLAPLANMSGYDSLGKGFCGVVKTMIEPYEFLLNYTNFPKKYKSWITDFIHGSPKSQSDYSACFSSGDHFLSLLRETFDRPVILLVDAYDAILSALLSHKFGVGDDNIMIDLEFFIRQFIKHDHETVHKALFLSTFDIGTLLPDHNIDRFAFFNNERTAKPFGFSEEDVKKLLEKFSLSEHFSSVQDYCGGYSVIGSRLSLFNILPVLRFINEKELRPFINESFPNRVLLRQFADLFSDDAIGFRIAQSIFEYDIAYMDEPRELHYCQLTSLKLKIEGKRDLLDFNDISLFLNLAVQTGLFSVSKSSDIRDLRIANNEAKGILLEYLERSDFSRKEFNISGKKKEAFKNALITLRPDQPSIDKFGDALYMLFNEKVPYIIQGHVNYLAAIYTYSKLTAREVLDFEVMAGLDGPKDGKHGKINIVLVWKQKDFGVIIQADFTLGARAALDKIIRCKFFDIFKARKEYLKYDIKHMALIGLSVAPEGGAVSMDYLVDSTNVGEAKEYKSDDRDIKSKKGSEHG